MSKINKKLEALKNNPKADWQISDLKSIAERLGIEHRQHGTSHVVFYHSVAKNLSVPAHKPIKPVYVKMFIKFIGECENV